jgi:hypothetical protein
MNNVVQWARSRFNECLEKSEIVGRKLQQAQRELPLDHPGHPSNHKSASSTSSGAVTTSAEHIQITSGVTAEKLMFERAVEMSRAAAVSELVGEDLNDCEIGYVTAIMLLEAVLESDDEPLIRRPSAKKDKPGDELINGMETEDRQHVIKREPNQQPQSCDEDANSPWRSHRIRSITPQRPPQETPRRAGSGQARSSFAACQRQRYAQAWQQCFPCAHACCWWHATEMIQ